MPLLLARAAGAGVGIGLFLHGLETGVGTGSGSSIVNRGAPGGVFVGAERERGCVVGWIGGWRLAVDRARG